MAWQKSGTKQNPRVWGGPGRFTIQMHLYTDYLWTGSSLMPGVKMWSGMKPKDFDTREEAENELVSTVLDHIVLYKSDLEKYIQGWVKV